MVGHVDRRGLRDWIAQRATAIVILVYFLILMALFSFTSLSFDAVHQLFSGWLMKIATVVVLLCISWHAWIGLWTVLTDYVKPKAIRLILEAAIILLLLAYVIWLLVILFG